MPEYQIFTDPNWNKWLITGLVGLVCSLMIYIWRQLKKQVNDLQKKYKFVRTLQQSDHDRIDKLTTEHCMYNKDSKLVP